MVLLNCSWYGQEDSAATSAAATAASIATKRKAAVSNSKAAKRQRKAAAQQLAAITTTTPGSPSYTPQSPTHQRPASPPPISLPLPPSATADTPSAHPQSSSPSPSPAPPPTTFFAPRHKHAIATATAGPHLPSPAELPLSTLPSIPALSGARLPAKFPAPPPLVPLTGEEVAQPSVAPEDLLTQALWAWYAAGYQTGLYHAAVGVAGAAAGPAVTNGGGDGDDMDLETE